MPDEQARDRIRQGDCFPWVEEDGHPVDTSAEQPEAPATQLRLAKLAPLTGQQV